MRYEKSETPGPRTEERRRQPIRPTLLGCDTLPPRLVEAYAILAEASLKQARAKAAQAPKPRPPLLVLVKPE